MSRRKEELKAAALWAFIERLRREPDVRAAGVDGLTPADAEELSALLQTAECLFRALEVSAEAPVGSASRRVHEAIAARNRLGDSRAPRRPRSLSGLLAPVARYGWAVAVVVALVIGGVVGRRLPPPDPLTHPPASVAALTHSETRERVPLLVAGRLSAGESRAVLWHLAHCDDCFAAYQGMTGGRKGREQQAGRGGAPLPGTPAGSAYRLAAGNSGGEMGRANP